MNKIKIINLPEITAADNTTYIPVSTGATNATRKISAANLIGFENVSCLPQGKTSQIVNGLTDVVDTSKNIIIYNNNDKLILPSAATMEGKSITVKNNFTSIIGTNTMEFTNSIGGTPANKTIQKKFGCPNLNTFLIVGSVIIVGGNETEMVVDLVTPEYITVTGSIPADVSIGNTISPGIPITVYPSESDSINGLPYELVRVKESKEFYSNGDSWFTI